jgi:GT2 family glycosyltransferase
LSGLTTVVVNYRTPGDLEEFLVSYAAFPPSRPAGLVVVNVSPTPEDAAMATRWSRHLPELRCISFDDNVGYGRACNRAACLDTGGDVLGFFNADVILAPRALDECYEAIAFTPGRGALGPRQVDSAGRLTSTGVYGPPSTPQFGAWLQHDRGQCSQVREDALTVSGAAYFIRRTVWRLMTSCPAFRRADPDAEGAFLQTPHYYEETWLSAHLRAHGYKVVFWGPTCVVHKWHQASPHGGHADQAMTGSRALYRQACRLHEIECE